MRSRKAFVRLTILMTLALVAATPVHAVKGGKGGGNGGGGNGGGGGSGEAMPRIAYTGFLSKNGSASWEVFIVNADGSENTQITTDDGVGSRYPTAWSQDNWLIVLDRGTSTAMMILDVSDPGTVTEVLSVALPTGSNPGDWAAKRAASDNTILPSTQQRIAFLEDSPEVRNVSARLHDGSDPIPLTSYVSTHTPGDPSAGGVRYRSSSPQWLPDLGNGSMRLYYFLRVSTFAGSSFTDSYEHRVVTMDASNWPAISVLSNGVLSGAAGPSAMRFSRDGSLVAWAVNDNYTGDDRILVAPVDYAADGSPTVRVAATSTIADDGSPGDVNNWSVNSFSADNSRVAVTGSEAKKGPGSVSEESVYVTSADQNGNLVEVDGRRKGLAARGGIWGP